MARKWFHLWILLRGVPEPLPCHENLDHMSHNDKWLDCGHDIWHCDHGAQTMALLAKAAWSGLRRWDPLQSDAVL